jgi:hypothetical protein
MASKGREKPSYIADPERRAYHRALRNIRAQVLGEFEKEMGETGFFGRLFLRFKIEKEIRKRCQAAPAPPRH